MFTNKEINIAHLFDYLPLFVHSYCGNCLLAVLEALVEVGSLAHRNNHHLHSSCRHNSHLHHRNHRPHIGCSLCVHFPAWSSILGKYLSILAGLDST